MARFLWTDELIEKGLAWQKKNQASNKQTAEYLGSQGKDIGDTWSAAKNKYLRRVGKTKRSWKPRTPKVHSSKVLDLPDTLPQTKGDPIALIILKPEQLQKIIGGLWQ